MESKTLPVSYDEIMACQILKTHIGNSNLSTYIKQVAEDFGYTKFLWDTINELGQPLQEEFDIITDTDNQQYLYHISIVSMLNLAEEVVRERIAREKAEKGEIIFLGEPLPQTTSEYAQILEKSPTGGYNKNLFRAITQQTQGILSACREYARHCTNEEAVLFLTRYWYSYIPEVRKFYPQ